LNETSLAPSDEKALTAEAGPGTVTAEEHPLVEQNTVVIDLQAPPLSAEDEFLEPRAGFWRRHRLFIVTVALPMAIAATFLLLVAAPRYSSTASFIVRSIDQSATQDALASLAPGLDSGGASDETYAINTYLTSRDVVEELAKNDNLRAILSRPQGDFVFRYPTFWLPDNKEFLYRRFQWSATADIDEESGITTLEVNAFSPEDAQALVRAMLRYAEALVNRMNERFYQSQVAVAERYVSDTQKELDATEAELKAFRSRSGSVDPSLVAQSELNVIQGLSTQLAQVEASIAQQLKLAPTTPALASLRAQAQSYRDEIEKRKFEIAGPEWSEAVKLQTYDQLTLQRALAVQALADAVAQKDLARFDAERQHLYVQIILQPSLALDWPRYPQTTFDLLFLLATCLGVFLVLRKLRDIAAEHRP